MMLNYQNMFICYAPHVVDYRVWKLQIAYPPPTKPSIPIIIDLNSKWTLPLCWKTFFLRQKSASLAAFQYVLLVYQRSSAHFSTARRLWCPFYFFRHRALSSLTDISWVHCLFLCGKIKKKEEKWKFRNPSKSLPLTCHYYAIIKQLYIVPCVLAFAHVLKVIYSNPGWIFTELYISGL